MNDAGGRVPCTSAHVGASQTVLTAPAAAPISASATATWSGWRSPRDGPPTAPYDLAVLGEVLYYFDADTAADVMRRWHEGITPGGHLVLVHHRPGVAEHVLDGDDVHAIADDLLGAPLVHVVDELFRVDVFTR